MDDCISNLVVTDNYVLQPVESIPISVVDYENGVAHLLHTGSSITTGPVLRLTSAAQLSKTNELHPLEVEVQRDLELKQRHLSRQQKPPANVPECTFEGIIKRSNQFVHLEDKQIGVANDSISTDNEAMHLQQIISNEKNSVLRPNNIVKSDCISGPQYIHNNKQMVMQTKQFIILPENHSLINNDWKLDKGQNNDAQESSNQSCSINEITESTQIPLTVQNYSCATFSSINSNNSKKCNKSKQKSDGEDDDDDEEEDDDNVEPVCDYEPDPESTMQTEPQDVEKPNKCYMCFKSFRQKKNMYAHIRKIHSTQPKIEGGILCPLCKMHALRQEHLRNHFEKLHDVKIEKEEKLFNNMEDFFSWKEYVERETLSLYVSKSSAKLLANNQQKTYYKCHRSGNYITLRKEDRKKKLKVQGSNKIGATCPAAMEVTENVHGVNVIFWKTHVGHDNDLAHLVLSKEDKAKIRGNINLIQYLKKQKENIECLNSGVAWDNVLEKIKKEAEKGPNSPSKLTMISKQDLRNLKKLHDVKNCGEIFPVYTERKKVCHGRKPMKERMLRRASQSLVIEKADLLLNLLETTEVIPEFRPKICLMIDNLISTIKRRAVKNTFKREKNHKKRRRKQNDTQTWTKPVKKDPKGLNDIDEGVSEESQVVSGGKINGDIPHENSEVGNTGNKAPERKRGRPKKTNGDASNKIRKTVHLANKFQ